MIYRGHLEQIAATVAKVNLADRRELAEGLAAILVLHNARFDRAKFFEACCVTPPRAVTIHIMLEPTGRSEESVNAAGALRQVAEMIGVRGFNGLADRSIIYDDDNNEIGHVTTETRDV